MKFVMRYTEFVYLILSVLDSQILRSLEIWIMFKYASLQTGKVNTTLAIKLLSNISFSISLAYLARTCYQVTDNYLHLVSQEIKSVLKHHLFLDQSDWSSNISVHYWYAEF